MASNKYNVLKFAVTPLPQNKQISGKDYISWGKDNCYPDYLIDLYLKSARHNAIINGKVDYIYGKGLTYDKKKIKPTDEALSIAFIKFFENKGNCHKFILDGELFNGVCFEIIWNKKKTKPVEINYIPFNKIRTNEDESKYFYSNNWKERIQDEKTGYKVFEPFDVNNPSDSQLYVYQIKSPKKSGEPNVYPTPNYQGATISIETDISVSNFDNSNLKSGFSSGTIINFNSGAPETEEAKAEIERKVKERTAGAEEAGNIIVSFNNGKDAETTVTSIAPSDLDKQNIEVDKRVEQRLFTAHKITNPALFGIRQEGAISGDNNLGKDYELFQSIYVSGRQAWHEKTINDLAFYFGVKTEIRFDRVNPITPQIDSSKISEAYTVQEIREMLGLPNIEVKTDTNKALINAINSLSPLVANKVLESLSVEEIRGLVGITAPAQPKVTTTMAQFKSEDVQLVFSKYGRNRDLFEVIKSKEYSFQNFTKQNFSDLTSLEKSILDLLSKDSTLEVPQLTKALKSNNKDVQNAYDNLIANDYLKSDKNGVSVTDNGSEILDTETAKTENYEVVFGYDWRNGFSNSDLKTSRDFCRNLIEKNLFYTKEEILSMENDLGTNVWEFGGGWRTKEDGTHVPTCRHLWHQYLVKLK